MGYPKATHPCFTYVIWLKLRGTYTAHTYFRTLLNKISFQRHLCLFQQDNAKKGYAALQQHASRKIQTVFCWKHVAHHQAQNMATEILDFKNGTQFQLHISEIPLFWNRKKRWHHLISFVDSLVPGAGVHCLSCILQEPTVVGGRKWLVKCYLQCFAPCVELSMWLNLSYKKAWQNRYFNSIYYIYTPDLSIIILVHL